VIYLKFDTLAILTVGLPQFGRARAKIRNPNIEIRNNKHSNPNYEIRNAFVRKFLILVI
jgi:hypothetical protein